MKDVKFIKLNDLYLIKDKENVFHLCINTGGKYFVRFNEFEINESKDKSSRIDLYARDIDRASAIALSGLLFGQPNSYADSTLSDCKIEGSVLYMWQSMINDENIQKTLNNIYSSSITEEQRKNFKTQLRKEFFKNLLRGYSTFTEETYPNSKSSDVYTYFDKEITY